MDGSQDRISAARDLNAEHRTNGCSPFEASGGHHVIHLPAIGRATAGRLRGGRAERIVGKGRAPSARDGILGNGHADFTRGWRTGPQDFDKGRPSGHAEDQAHGQKRELADGHEAGISRVQSPRTEGSIPGQRSCASWGRQLRDACGADTLQARRRGW